MAGTFVSEQCSNKHGRAGVSVAGYSLLGLWLGGRAGSAFSALDIHSGSLLHGKKDACAGLNREKEKEVSRHVWGWEQKIAYDTEWRRLLRWAWGGREGRRGRETVEISTFSLKSAIMKPNSLSADFFLMNLKKTQEGWSLWSMNKVGGGDT